MNSREASVINTADQYATTQAEIALHALTVARNLNKGHGDIREQARGENRISTDCGGTTDKENPCTGPDGVCLTNISQVGGGLV